MSKFHAKSTAMEVVEGRDLSGYTILITGGTDGIGRETVKALAKAGAHVIIGARNRDKGLRVADELRKETGSEKIDVEWLDLDCLSNVRKFLATFTGRPLHVLINNAGILPDHKAYTPDGFESAFGVNHMSHFVLTCGLLPLLREGAKQRGVKSRVITLSSRAHLRSEIGFEDVNYKEREYEPLMAYGQSKTANASFAFQLAKLYSQDIVSYSVHPGLVATNMLLQMPLEERMKHGLADKDGNLPDWAKTVEEGASTTVWAAVVADESEAPNGSYLNDCAVAVCKPDENRIEFKDHIYDQEKAEKLWQLSEEWASKPPSSKQ